MTLAFWGSAYKRIPECALPDILEARQTVIDGVKAPQIGNARYLQTNLV